MLTLKPMKLKSIKRIDNKSNRYDIQVRNNHNMFANGILTHNCTLYNHGLHARSINQRSHPSRAWLYAFHRLIAHQIPDNMRICGEYLYARHSIAYDSLPSFFLVFGIYEGMVALSWDDVQTLCSEIQYTLNVRVDGVEQPIQYTLETVPVLYRGVWDEQAIRACYSGKSAYGSQQEGYVVRTGKSFQQENFAVHTAKYVRANHVNTDSHWMHQSVVPNKLARA